VGVADLSVVWVWADFYQDELQLLKKGERVTISTPGFPGETFVGKIDLIDPFLNDAKRTARARISVENPDYKLRPEMYVDATLESDQGKGLAIPASAVLPTGTRNVVFVNKGEGKLEPRFVELGRAFGNFYAVKSGLHEGEQIVASANFLIDAEAKVQGALQQW
jgi:Cu(I)/Ag(I) efflux system membrane fusion protein